MFLFRIELRALHFPGGHAPNTVQIRSTQFSAGGGSCCRHKVEFLSVNRLQHHGIVLFHIARHGCSIAVLVHTLQFQSAVLALLPSAFQQTALVAVSYKFPELGRSVFVEVEVRFPFACGHLADFRAVVIVLIGFIPHRGPIGSIVVRSLLHGILLRLHRRFLVHRLGFPALFPAAGS